MTRPTDIRPVSPDRRLLGDAWRDWDGARDPDQGTVRAGAGPFLGLVALLALLAAGLWTGLLWIAEPRLGALGLPEAARSVVRSVGAFAILAPIALLAFVAVGGRLPSLAARLLQRTVVSAWPWAGATGRLLGMSRDRLAHSFLRLTNRLAVQGGIGRADRELLVLAPRCLRRDLREALQRIAAENGARFAVVGGGGQAREEIDRSRPAGVLAVACERDLVEGVRGVGPRLAVLSLPNRRPDGPCRNSEVDLDEARRMLAALRGAARDGA